MSHTPGPWAIREPEDGELHEVYAENGGDLICYPVYTANQKANIPLIAAAPELLRELKHLLALWEESIAYEPDYMHLGDAARAVIAKAEGRSE